jgi:hypothetical protein
MIISDANVEQQQQISISNCVSPPSSTNNECPLNTKINMAQQSESNSHIDYTIIMEGGEQEQDMTNTSNMSCQSTQMNLYLHLIKSLLSYFTHDTFTPYRQLFVEHLT